MELTDYLRIFRKRGWIVILVALVVVSVAYRNERAARAAAQEAEVGFNILELESDVAGSEDKPIYIMHIQGYSEATLEQLEQAVADAIAAGGMVHLFGTGVLDRYSGLRQRSGGIDHVIENHGHLVADVAYDSHRLSLVGCRAPLVDNGKIGIQALGKGSGAFDPAGIR